MNPKTISVIALSNRDFPDFTAKLAEAVRWIEFAAKQGSSLAVLPETINLYRGDGVAHPNPLSLDEAALDNWEKSTAVLFEAARRCKIAVTIPVLIREKNVLSNCFFLISNTGKILGQYRKTQPTKSELDCGIQPGKPMVFDWEGIKVGGAICFDTNFPSVFEQQAKAGAQLFLVPSLWPGGSGLNYFALRYSAPIALAYPAWSRIIDITGKEVADGGYRSETLRFGFGAPVYTATLNFDRVTLHADYNQDKIVALQEKYGSRVHVEFDQQNCLFFLASNSPDFTTRNVLKEFGMQTAQEYFASH